MLKRYLFVFLILSLSAQKVKSQDFSALWEDYFSFFEIVDITKSDTKIYAASENVVFSYDVNTNEIEKINVTKNRIPRIELIGDILNIRYYKYSSSIS